MAEIGGDSPGGDGQSDATEALENALKNPKTHVDMVDELTKKAEEAPDNEDFTETSDAPPSQGN